VTALDWGIIALVAVTAVWAFRAGFFTGVLSVALLAAFIWAIGSVALHAPISPELRRDVQRSLIFRNFYEVLPPTESMIEAFQRVDPAPLLDLAAAPVGPPDAAIARDPAVRAAQVGVVRVVGTACGLGVVGSGWAVAPRLVVTNAHVVAGSDDTRVETSFGESHDAEAVHYQPRDDLAVLRVDADLAPLRIVDDPGRGTRGAVLGYPESGPFTIVAARYAGEQEVISEDSYGRGPIPRTVASLRGAVRSGNSGGPLVDANGRVMGTVFATRVDSGAGSPSGYAIPNDVVRRALRRATGPVDTGPCTG